MNKSEVNKTFYLSIITCIMFVVFGVFLMYESDTTIVVISRIITIMTSIIGLFGLYKYISREDKTKKIDINIIYGIISFIVALICFFYPLLISGLIPIVLGIFMVISVLSKMGYLKYISKRDDYGICLFIFIILMVLGLILIFNPLEDVLNINQTMGMLVIFYGIMDVVECSLFKNNVIKIEEELE